MKIFCVLSKNVFSIIVIHHTIAQFWEFWSCIIIKSLCTVFTKAYIVMYLILKKATEGLNWSFACMLRRSSHVWLCNPVNCSLPGSSVCGSLQARILEWVATPFSRGSSQPRDRNCLECLMSPALAGGFFTTSATWEAQDSLTAVSLIEQSTDDTVLQE